MDDIYYTVASMVIKAYSTGNYNNGELISVKLLRYTGNASNLYSALINRGYKSVIHNVDGTIGVEITSGDVVVGRTTVNGYEEFTMKKVKLIDNYGTWTIGKKKPLRDGVKIEQGGYRGILRFSHKSTDRGHGYSIDINHWVIVTEDYRLVPLQSGEALIGE